MTGGTDHDPGEGHYAAGLLAQARAEDRVRWRGRASWNPVLTYGTVMIASGWLAGAWYAWQINADGATMTVCFVGALSTIFPGIPWRELLEMSRRPAEERPLRNPDEILAGWVRILDWSTGKTVEVDTKTGRPVAEVRRCDEA